MPSSVNGSETLHLYDADHNSSNDRLSCATSSMVNQLIFLGPEPVQDLILSRGRRRYNSLQYGRSVISTRALLILSRGRRRYNSLQHGRTEMGKRHLDFAPRLS